MNLVFCDNSCLSAMAEIGLLEVLPRIVGPVYVPASVAAEGSHPGAPEALRNLFNNPPTWLVIVSDPEEILEEAGALGAGEAAVITLVWRNRETGRLIIDEKRGRAGAKALGLRVTGLLAILVEAALVGEVDFEEALAKLLATGFRLSQQLMDGARAAAQIGPGL